MSIKRLSGAGLTTPKSNKLWDQTTFQSGMFALATVSLTSNQSTVSFTGIPANYTHLQIRGIARCNSATTYNRPLVAQFNTDTTTGNYYAYHILTGDTTAANFYSGAAGSIAGGYVGRVAGGSGVANTFAPFIVDILDYSNTTKNKTTKSFTGTEGQTTALDNEVSLISSLWKSTAAITQIDLKVNSGDSFVSGSQFALYGIKSA